MPYIRLVLCLIMLSAPMLGAPGPAEAAASPPSALPADVFIKTPKRTFNSRFYYALHEGRIWIKANRQVTGRDEPWQPMGCDGLPCQNDNPDFPMPESIYEISADGDELTAIDNLGRFYVRTMAGPGWFSKTEWTHLNGFPKGVLSVSARLAGRRAWSMGRRHYDVLWHEDADNNPHHVGVMGTSSLYMLNQDGSEIWFTDNGLPPDFSNIACGPERGTVVSENLQASAGTLFLIDAGGQMYTSMDDFDLNGGTSMFISYTYTPQPQYQKPPGSDYQSNLKPWRLPLEHWKKQPAIPLAGSARISKEITILQNGQGNAARELRVAGTNAAGQTGYYFKPIFAESWSFKPAALEIGKDSWLEPAKAGRTRVLPKDISYSGALRFTDDLGNQQTYMAEVKDFNLHCSPATLRLFLPDGPVDMTLHSVDAWISVTRLDPGRDGSLQLRLGTIEAAPDQLKKLPKLLQDLNLKPFQLHVGATTDHLILFFLDGSLQGTLPRIQPLSPSIQTHNYHYTLPPGAYATSRLRRAKLDMSRSLDPSLVRVDLEQVPAEELELLAHYSRELLKQLQAESELISQAKQQAWGEAMFATTLRGIYSATGMCWWVPNGQAVCRTAPTLLGAGYRIEDDLNRDALIRYNQLISQVTFRLGRYEDRLRELKGPHWEPSPPSSRLVTDADPSPSPQPGAKP